MKPRNVFAAGLLVGVAAQLGIRIASSRRALDKRELRQRALRRMAEAVERSGAQRTPSTAATSGGTAVADISRFALPIGLRLDHARQVIEAARHADAATGANCHGRAP